MSGVVSGKTYHLQTVGSKNDRHLYSALNGRQDAITRGCSLTKDSNKIYVTVGDFIIQGGHIAVESLTDIAFPTVTSGSLYCILIYEIDLSKTNTASSFLQGEFKILSNSSAYPTLVQQDLDENPTGKYQMEFARFRKTVSSVLDWTLPHTPKTIAQRAVNEGLPVELGGTGRKTKETTSTDFEFRAIKVASEVPTSIPAGCIVAVY